MNWSLFNKIALLPLTLLLHACMSSSLSPTAAAWQGKPIIFTENFNLFKPTSFGLLCRVNHYYISKKEIYTACINDKYSPIGQITTGTKAHITELIPVGTFSGAKMQQLNCGYNMTVQIDSGIHKGILINDIYSKYYQNPTPDSSIENCPVILPHSLR